MFVPLSRLQDELDLGDRVNTLLVATLPEGRAGTPAAAGGLIELEQLVRSEATLEDIGLTVKALDARRTIIVGSNAGLLDDAQAAVVQEELSGCQPVFTYLANTLRRGDREIPYSLVTATDLRAIAPAVPPRATAEGPPFPIALNEWAARELQAAVGDPITMEYYVWEEPGQLATRTSEFRVAAVVPIDAGDRDLAPAYPGISDSPSLADWDPPFPIDLRRIRPADEAYWNEYRTTPKAFVPLEVGQRSVAVTIRRAHVNTDDAARGRARRGASGSPGSGRAASARPHRSAGGRRPGCKRCPRRRAVGVAGRH